MLQANKWCGRGVDLLASQGIEQCTTESGAESALSDIDTFTQQVSELQLDDMEQFRQQCTRLLDSTAVVCLSISHTRWPKHNDITRVNLIHGEKCVISR